MPEEDAIWWLEFNVFLMVLQVLHFMWAGTILVLVKEAILSGGVKGDSRDLSEAELQQLAEKKNPDKDTQQKDEGKTNGDHTTTTKDD